MFCKIKPVVSSTTEYAEKTLLFAAWELQKYLKCVLDGDFPVIRTNTYIEDDKNTIYLGINLSEKLEKADVPELDDNILIDVENFCGVITGTNPRSVLIGVYRFLKEKGFMFLHPGKYGEVTPKSINGNKVYVSEKAYCRYRAISIEGSVFQENLMELIDWLPKVAMNGYFVQFTVPFVFFDRYYSDSNSDITYLGEHRESYPISHEEVSSMIELLELEIEKRDLQYHSIGHGWTSKAFGIESTSWEPMKIKLTDEQKSIMAQINGKRDLFQGMPMSTQLCFSNPKARSLMIDGVINHLKAHKNVTHLHFWIADGHNNYCECEECKKLRISDYFVMILNELDERLTVENIHTKIIFEISGAFNWKPLQEKIKNTDRFVFSIAPITRTFSEPLHRVPGTKMKDYNAENKMVYPKKGADIIAYLDDWMNDYDADCLNFDYHFIWDHYYDFSQYQLSGVLYDDLRNYKDLNLDGIISCQVQRAFTPTSLGMHVMARTLWNRETSFEVIEKETLSAEFGENYKKVINYLCELSKCSCAKVLRCETLLTADGIYESLIQTIKILDTFETEILNNISASPSEQLKRAWEKLHFHNRLYKKMLEFYLNFNNPNVDLEPLKKEIYDFAKAHEAKFKDEFDAYYFCWVFELLILPRLRNTEVIK